MMFFNRCYDISILSKLEEEDFLLVRKYNCKSRILRFYRLITVYTGSILSNIKQIQINRCGSHLIVHVVFNKEHLEMMKLTQACISKGILKIHPSMEEIIISLKITQNKGKMMTHEIRVNQHIMIVWMY